MSETDTAPAAGSDANQDPAGGSTGAQNTQTTDPGTGGQDGANGSTSSGTSQAGTAGTTATTAADDKTAQTVAAIRQDFKAERERRQKAEQEFQQFKADAEKRDADRQAAEAERNKKLAIALGVASEDEPPDPAKLLEELKAKDEQHQSALAARDAEVRQRDIRLAVLTQAPGLEANGALLMDSLSFLRKVEGLDPAAGDFGERLGEQIEAATKANPNYKLTPPKQAAAGNGQPQRSGGEHVAPGGNRQWTVEDVDRASPSEVVAAQEAGLLADLGYQPRKNRR